MTHDLEWLPQKLDYEEFGANWEVFLSAVYAVFDRDFKRSRFLFRGGRMLYDGRILPGEEKEEGFWHLISEHDPHTGDRLPNIARAERVPWVKPVLLHPSDPAVSVWENKRRRQVRVLVWLEAHDYLVVLRPSRQAYMLVTAYVTDRKHTRRKLRFEREDYRKQQTPP